MTSLNLKNCINIPDDYTGKIIWFWIVNVKQSLNIF